MKKICIYLLLMLALLLPACKKMLDIDRSAENNTAPVSVQDFEQMLNSPGICQTPFYLTDEVTDDAYRPIVGAVNSGHYDWIVQPWGFDNIADDPMYRDSYKWIAQMNLVISNMPVALPAGQMNERRAVAIAQAKINRAYFYLQLVNIYGKHYQSATAATDLGVPLPLRANNQILLARSTVAEVYQQILTDLQEALATSELPNTDPKNIIYPGKAAAFALLARTYLYMGDYPRAEKAASDALAVKRSLLSYLAYGEPGDTDGRLISLVDQKKNEEVLLPRIFSTNVGMPNPFSDEVLFFSDELRALFNQANDKRYSASISVSNGSYAFGISGFSYSYNYSIGVPEMILIKAECLARANDPAGAINLLNELRAKRIRNYTNLSTVVSADVALTQVLEERRRELMFKGLRLFDLKRFNLDPRFKKDIVRKMPDGKVWATLPAGSPNYVFAFTRANLNSNRLLVQNPRVELK